MDSQKFKKQFGIRVKELRLRLGLSQEQLAEKIGKTVNSISNIERGSVAPKFETIAEIADILGVELSELFDVSDEISLDKNKRKEIEKIVYLLKAQSLETIRAVRQQVKISVGLKK